jgi:hypothetical protein
MSKEYLSVIDPQLEPLISLAAAAKLIPPARTGRRTHLSTLIRWITTGAKAPDGVRVRLEGYRMGSRWMTSAAALTRFMEALTPRLNAEPAPAPRSPAGRRRESERAAKELERAGI